MPDINELLQRRGARMKGGGGDRDLAARRAELLRRIAAQYPLFERVRDWMMLRGHEQHDLSFAEAEIANELLEILGAEGIVVDEHGIPHPASTPHRQFLSGGWLEELAFLAAVAAGADEAVFGQMVSWKAGGYEGENEIDLIVRRGPVLGFVSCKALKSSMNAEDRKHRTRLMDALHEADNLTDHFGGGGERVAVLVTTDLFDEMKGVPRYQALMGKAAVLDVRVIPLEELGWERLVRAMAEFWNDPHLLKGHSP